jgi:hypothetical protein
MTDNRALARNLVDVGVAAADPYSAVALLRGCWPMRKHLH